MIWAYYIGVAFLRQQGIALVAGKYLALAALIHGLYDFIVIALPLSALPLSALLILAVWVWRMYLIRDLQRKMDRPHGNGG